MSLPLLQIGQFLLDGGTGIASGQPGQVFEYALWSLVFELVEDALQPASGQSASCCLQGEVRQRYREGQEEQLGALGLVVNAVVLWNTLYMHRALEEMRGRGMKTATEDIERLSPLGYDHINFLGRYTFSLSEEIRLGTFHPLRELAETEQEEAGEQRTETPPEETIA